MKDIRNSRIIMSTKLQEGVITFDAASKQEILSYFGKKTDQDGYIIETENPTQRAITPDGEDITIEEFAGIRNGPEIYIKSDLPSLIELIDIIG